MQEEDFRNAMENEDIQVLMRVMEEQRLSPENGNEVSGHLYTIDGRASPS